MLEVGAKILIVGVPPLAENYCDGLAVLPRVEKERLLLALPVERDCFVTSQISIKERSKVPEIQNSEPTKTFKIAYSALHRTCAF